MREMPAATAEEEKSKKFKGFGKPAGFIWSVADLLRGDYKQADCGKVILPYTVLRRLHCVVDCKKAQVLRSVERADCLRRLS
jgi:type I restriction-modification system DNA methylase subunit